MNRDFKTKKIHKWKLNLSFNSNKEPSTIYHLNPQRKIEDRQTESSVPSYTSLFRKSQTSYPFVFASLIKGASLLQTLYIYLFVLTTGDKYFSLVRHTTIRQSLSIFYPEFQHNGATTVLQSSCYIPSLWLSDVLHSTICKSVTYGIPCPKITFMTYQKWRKQWTVKKTN